MKRWQGEKLLKEPGQCRWLNEATVRVEKRRDTRNVGDGQYRVAGRGGETEKERQRKGKGGTGSWFRLPAPPPFL